MPNPLTGIISDDLLAAHPEWGAQQNNDPNAGGIWDSSHDPNGMPVQQAGGTQTNLNPTGAPMPMPTGTSQAVNGQAVANPPMGQAATNQWQNSINLLDARQQDIHANIRTLPAKQQVVDAQENVLNTMNTDIAANRNYIAEQERANQVRMQEHQGIMAAQGDAADIAKTAKAQREQTRNDYRFQIAGLPVPITVKMPEGFSGRMPPGTRQRIDSMAEILTEKAKDAEEMRKFNIEAARIKAANTGLDVTAAQVAKGKVQLTLDELQLAAEAAGWNVQQEQLNYDRSRVPSAPGLVLDDVTGDWTTPSVANLNRQMEADRVRNEIMGTFGSIPVDTLMSMATQEPPVITDEQLRQGIIAQGGSPATADEYVKLAAARRAAGSEKTDLQVLIDSIINGGGGGGNAPTAPQQRQPNGGAWGDGGSVVAPGVEPPQDSDVYKSPGGNTSQGFAWD